jgi:hypothetical protein
MSAMEDGRLAIQAPNVPDLRSMEYNLANCHYESVDAFLADLNEFFLAVQNVYGRDHDSGRSASRYASDLKQVMAGFQQKTTASVDGVKEQLKRLAAVEVGDIGEKIEAGNNEELAKALSGLDARKRMQAEWIVRIHCPSMPYYANRVDLDELPFTAIESLKRLVLQEA